MYNFNIVNCNVGDIVTDVFIVKSKKDDIARNGKRFLNIVLSNINGDYEAKVWNANDEVSEIFDNNIVMIKGKIDEFNGVKQINISNYRMPSEDQVDISKLIKTSKKNEQEMIKYIEDTIEEINGDYKEVTKYIYNNLKSAYVKIGAASSNHHNYVHGLLEHSYCILKMAKFMANMYELDKDRLFSGAILHDIGKTYELQYNDFGIIESYTMAGNLIGHITLGAQEITKACLELRNQGINISKESELIMSHMIVSHHSQQSFGSPKMPAFKEAEMLYRLDSIDAFMQIFDNINDKLEDGQMSERQYNLGGRVIAKI